MRGRIEHPKLSRKTSNVACDVCAKAFGVRTRPRVAFALAM